MKFFHLLAVSACTFIIFHSCEKQSIKANSERSFGSPFTSVTNEHVIVKDEQSTVLISVKNISDLRCLNHLNCEDPGEATVRIEISNMNNSKAETMLYLGTSDVETQLSDSVDVKLDEKLYTVHLTSVSPHPFEVSSSQKTAEMFLNKR